MATRKVRYKKLNTKTQLAVLREDEIDPTEYESLTTENQISTGVEQAEENEYHLQAALKGAGTTTDNEIPVPPPQESKEVDYDEIYASKWVEPKNYIKSSDTVEEALGCLYDMTTEDDAWLKNYNAKKAANAQLSEDDFERIMEVFEDTAAEHTPFASVDNTQVAFPIMQQTLEQVVTKQVQAHSKTVYDYWVSRRKENGNRRLHATLKFETHQEHDDMDPYVCFRRREVRQTRKTRARDVQVVDKLKRLRRELEDGRQLIVYSHQRELLKWELLKHERKLYEARASLKESKVRLGIKTDDEDLYTSKEKKRKIQEVQQAARGGAPNSQLRLAVRTDGRTLDAADLTLLSDKMAEKENELRADIETKVQNHRRWNQNYVDLTHDPLPPVKGEEVEQSFRPAKTQYLLTPPASASDEMEVDEEPPAMELVSKQQSAPYVFRGVSPDESEPIRKFRRRVGRNGRIWIDRRPIVKAPPSPPREMDWAASDRAKYDDDDDDDEQPVYEVDPFSTRGLKFRSTIPFPPSMSLMFRRQVPDGSTAGQAAAANRPALTQQAQAAQAASVSATAATAATTAAAAQTPTQPQVQPTVQSTA